MCKDRAEVLEALAPGGVFFEEQVERLGALVRLCSNEECFKEAIGAKPDIGDEACDVGWCLGGPRRGVADLHFGWSFFAFGGRSTPWAKSVESPKSFIKSLSHYLGIILRI
jgi:hypothetical protein